MKRFLMLPLVAVLLLSLCACAASPQPQVVATTLPVYNLTRYLCQNTDITIGQLITENVSCLHDYTLQVSQMRMIESADTVILSGAGLEDFMYDVLRSCGDVIDASAGIELLCTQHSHDHSEEDHAYSHSSDPHIWLSPVNAKIMAGNICDELCIRFPDDAQILCSNLTSLQTELDLLYSYGQSQLSQLRSRDIITFHDGFSYFAECFDLNILHAVEEESGSEASASELIYLIELVESNDLCAIFTETNGSTAAAEIVAAETGISVFTLDMAMSGDDYFNTMYRNIDTIKEALG